MTQKAKLYWREDRRTGKQKKRGETKYTGIFSLPFQGFTLWLGQNI